MAPRANWKGFLRLSLVTCPVALFTSTSSAISATVTPATYTAFATDGHEVGTTNTGYSTGGAAAASPTLTGGGATATITFDVADVSWTAGSATLVARAAVLYDDTATAKNAIAYMLLDSAPADVTVASGNTLTINIANVFTDA